MTATCNRCNKHNLVWCQSKKGNWYLADPKTVTTKSGNHITISYGHRCRVEETFEKNESFLFDLQPRSGA